MSIMFALMLAQLDFSWQEPIDLQVTEQASLERFAVGANRIMIRDEAASVVYLLDQSGQFLKTLNEFTAPYQITYLAETQNFVVYDAGARTFTFWSPDGDLQQSVPTTFDTLTEIGELTSVEGGYIAPISPTADGQFLLTLLDESFQPVAYQYPMVKRDMSSLAPSLHQTMAVKISSDDKTYIIAAQHLARQVSLFKPDLNPVTTLRLNVRTWRDPNKRRLERSAQNPRELWDYGQRYDSIVAMEALYNSVFIAGIRKSGGIEYQVFDAINGLPVAANMESPYLLKTVDENMLYFIDPGAGIKQLRPMRLRR